MLPQPNQRRKTPIHQRIKSPPVSWGNIKANNVMTEIANRLMPPTSQAKRSNRTQMFKALSDQVGVSWGLVLSLELDLVVEVVFF